MRSKKLKQAIAAIVDPVRENTLERRRRRLGLSRAALARILEVDPASVYRHERNPMTALWDYALRGLEAEASASGTQAVLRSFKSIIKNEKTFMPEQMDAGGYKLTAEKMRDAACEQTKPDKPLRRMKPKSAPQGKLNSFHTAHALSPAAVKAAVDRAVARSQAQKK